MVHARDHSHLKPIELLEAKLLRQGPAIAAVYPPHPASCASELAKKRGASKSIFYRLRLKITLVAGFSSNLFTY